MRRTTCLLVALAVALQLAAAAPATADLRPSEVAAPQPAAEVDQAEGEDSERNSRAVEPAVNTKFGIKNFILDFIFGKINQAIDAKTQLVAQLDRLNIEKNRNLLNTDCENAAAGGGGGGGGGGATASASFGGYPASQSSTASGGGASASADRAGTTATAASVTDDIPEFDRNAVRLDLPGELFGSSVNLVNRGSKVVGEVIMNTAVRFQRLVQALSPLFGRKLGITATRTRRDAAGGGCASAVR